MSFVGNRGRWTCLAVGLLLGMVVGGVLPNAPVHAVSTDRAENITVATGLVDDGVEAFYFLDALTGTLQGVVPSAQTPGAFQSEWVANPNRDLRAFVARAGRRVRLPDAPKYTLVTGMLDLKRGAARATPGRSVVYVTEVNTGVVLCYVAPWNASQHSANQPLQTPMTLWAVRSFATAVARDAE